LFPNHCFTRCNRFGRQPCGLFGALGTCGSRRRLIRSLVRGLDFSRPILFLRPEQCRVLSVRLPQLVPLVSDTVEYSLRLCPQLFRTLKIGFSFSASEFGSLSFSPSLIPFSYCLSLLVNSLVTFPFKSLRPNFCLIQFPGVTFHEPDDRGDDRAETGEDGSNNRQDWHHVA
jgi:hypothetical protein